MHFSIYICIENLYKMIPIYGEMGFFSPHLMSLMCAINWY